MIYLRDTIATIKTHLDDGGPQSLCYAALECRLTLERICYERLRNAHDYIGHEEIRRWPPHHVIKLLIEDVDPEIASTLTISISDRPVDDAVPYDPESYNYVPLGTQIGFDGATISKLWNALSNTALHIRMPQTKEESVSPYGDPEIMRPKIEAALSEIERIAVGTLISSGSGREVSFTCDCGTKIKRRAALVPPGKIVHCINPSCDESYEAEHEGGDINFIRRAAYAACTCGREMGVPLAPLEKLKARETLTAPCECGADHVFHWRLYRGVLEKGAAKKAAGLGDRSSD